MRPRRRLLPGAWRRVAWVVAPVCLAVAAGLGVLYSGRDGPGALDRIADAALRTGSPDWRGPLWAVVDLGDPLFVAAALGLVAAVAVAGARWEALPLIVVAPVLTAGLTGFVLQPGIGRLLNGGWAYPSGHTATIASLAAVLLVLLAGARRPASAGVRLALAGAGFAVTGAVAGALVALELHYVTDTVGAACLAVGVALVVALASDALAVPE